MNKKQGFRFDIVQNPQQVGDRVLGILEVGEDVLYSSTPEGYTEVRISIS